MIDMNNIILFNKINNNRCITIHTKRATTTNKKKKSISSWLLMSFLLLVHNILICQRSSSNCNRIVLGYTATIIASSNIIIQSKINNKNKGLSSSSFVKTAKDNHNNRQIKGASSLPLSSSDNNSWFDTIASKLKMSSNNKAEASSNTNNMLSFDSSLLLDHNEIINKIDTWEHIKEKYYNVVPEAHEYRNDIQKGIIASPMNKIRLFHNDDKPRVIFYRDSASWCPYCQKVWIALEYKQISYEIQKINMSCYGSKPSTFYQMQPSGQIPVAIILRDIHNNNIDKTLRQSNDILQALDDYYPTSSNDNNNQHRSLVPSNVATNNEDNNRYYSLLKLERQIFSCWLQWLTSGNGKDSFLKTLDKVENELKKSDGPFFMGKSFSLVDIQFIPFLERMVASMLYYKGYQIRYKKDKNNEYIKYPHINQWFDAIETLPEYQLTKSDYYTHCWDLSPQLGGCVMDKARAPYVSMINGEDNKSWNINTLDNQLNDIEPNWDWCCNIDNNYGKYEVIERLVHNYQNIILFTSRGAGSKGFPSVSAPLADPNAKSNTDSTLLHSISLLLQTVCMILFIPSTATTTTISSSSSNEMIVLQELIRTIQTSTSKQQQNDLIQSLQYLRDRIGVPRDMRLPAARQLRCHLNLIIDLLLQQK